MKTQLERTGELLAAMEDRDLNDNEFHQLASHARDLARKLDAETNRHEQMKVKRYDPECEYIGSGEYLPNMKEDANGDYVLASDYAAIKADRDELRRRLDAILAFKFYPEWMDEIWTSADGDRVDAMREVAFQVKAKIRAIVEEPGYGPTK